MDFENMNAVQRRLHNAACVLDADGDEYGYVVVLRDAIDDIAGLRTRMIELLEILRNWEPDNASGEERQTILQAMYQTGILMDPTETLRNMTEADFVRAHG